MVACVLVAWIFQLSSCSGVSLGVNAVPQIEQPPGIASISDLISFVALLAALRAAFNRRLFTCRSNPT